MAKGLENLTNGPKVYPLNQTRPGPNGDHVYSEGMEIRDHFAGVALGAFMSNSDSLKEINALHEGIQKISEEEIDFAEFMAVSAYVMADAMMKARKPKDPNP